MLILEVVKVHSHLHTQRKEPTIASIGSGILSQKHLHRGHIKKYTQVCELAVSIATGVTENAGPCFQIGPEDLPGRPLPAPNVEPDSPPQTVSCSTHSYSGTNNIIKLFKNQLSVTPGGHWRSSSAWPRAPEFTNS